MPSGALPLVSARWPPRSAAGWPPWPSRPWRARAAAAASSLWIRTPPLIKGGAGEPRAGEAPPEGGGPGPASAAGAAPAASDPPAGGAGPAPLRDRRIWRLATGGALLVAGQLSVVGYLTLFLHDRRGWSAGSAAAMLAVVQLGGAVMRVLAGRWSDRRGVRIAPMRELA